MQETATALRGRFGFQKTPKKKKEKKKNSHKQKALTKPCFFLVLFTEKKTPKTREKDKSSQLERREQMAKEASKVISPF